ncbi:hypothetical protein GJ496_002793 [Pomphorhynchus laevis]|nr:hypothetical protein GJ496_002793 [Pomphorhynchus laevis]
MQELRTHAISTPKTGPLAKQLRTKTWAKRTICLIRPSLTNVDSKCFRVLTCTYSEYLTASPSCYPTTIDGNNRLESVF